MKTFSLGDFYSFIDGRMIGDAAKPENLIEAKPKDVLEERFLDAALSFAFDEPIQGGLPAHHTIDQFLTKAAIGRRKMSFGQKVFEGILDEPSPLQNLDSNFSWILAAHNL